MGISLLPGTEGEWTPELTFTTPGNLSNSYTTQQGRWRMEGSLMWVSCLMTVTPTHSTASGNLWLTGLPVPMGPQTPRTALVARLSGSPVAWGGRSTIIGEISENTSYVRMIATGENLGGLILNSTHVTSGGLFNIRFSGHYPVN